MDKQRIGAVIPIKLTIRAKTRLAPVLTTQQRQSLVFKILDHMLKQIEQTEGIDDCFVITPDGMVVDFVRRYYPFVKLLPDAGGLNESAALAAKKLKADGYDSMLFLLGDLPLLSPRDLLMAMEEAREHAVVLMPDRKGRGTNGVFLSPPDIMSTSFGADSFQRHLMNSETASLDTVVLKTEGLSHDLDTPDDLYHTGAMDQYWG